MPENSDIPLLQQHGWGPMTRGMRRQLEVQAELVLLREQDRAYLARAANPTAASTPSEEAVTQSDTDSSETDTFESRRASLGLAPIVDLNLIDVNKLLDHLTLTPLHLRNGQIKWTVAEIFDLSSMTHDPNIISKPPLVIYAVRGRLSGRSDVRGRWVQQDMCITQTGANRVEDFNWVASYDLGWDYPSTARLGEKACRRVLGAHARIDQLLQEFKLDIKRDLDEEDPKVYEIAALALKVSPVLMLCDAGVPARVGAGRYIVEEKREGTRMRYIYGERFITRQVKEDLTEDAIQAFNHSIYIRSEKQAVIAKLDCISDSVLTNLELADLRLIRGKDSDSARWAQDFLDRFPLDHVCNVLCKSRGLEPFAKPEVMKEREEVRLEETAEKETETDVSDALDSSQDETAKEEESSDSAEDSEDADQVAKELVGNSD